MKIRIYLSGSILWWVYLAIKSNPAIIPQIDKQLSRAIFFDDGSLDLVAHSLRYTTKRDNAYFYIFRDGLLDDGKVEKAEQLIGPGLDLTVLVVGHFSVSSARKHKVQSLYAPGPLQFSISPLRFDLRTATKLLVERAKTLLMPLKNILRNPGGISQPLKLVLGSKQIVFCGSYGTIPAVIETLCDRRHISFRLFDGYDFYCQDPNQKFDKYLDYLKVNGAFLAKLHDQDQVDDTFFLSAVHLLGREYFIERIRSTGMALFANGLTSGVNINVYTTPFYSQHIFIDFGSVVGIGNYPRLADLKYFRKQIVEIKINEIAVEALLSMARAERLHSYFDDLWNLSYPQLLRSME